MRERAVAMMLCCGLGVGAAGQTAKHRPATTFQVSTRVVLTDVTVTDSRGNPVRGLNERDFRIFDNGRPETLKSFEEHTAKGSAAFVTAPQASGVYTNAGMLRPPAVVNVILIDTTTIDLLDQMYLYQQMTKFVEKLPAGEPVAIFCRAGQMTLLLQGFTSDHAQLMQAIRRAIPHFQQPDAEYSSDFGTLQQIAYYLSQVPGKKNLLWFGGGSRIYMQLPVASNDPSQSAAAPQAEPTPTESVPFQPDWRQIYGVLEAERITLYPIDARGLVTYSSQATIGQHEQMDENAEATGGQARYNTNGLAQAAERIVATDGDYYTLTYSPDDLHDNGRWHGVEVKLREAGYRLSYRRGYFDDQKNGESPLTQTSALLEAKGKTKQVLDEQSEPIAFAAQVVEISPVAEAAEVRAGRMKAPKDGELPYAIVYHVPASALAPQSVGADDRGTYIIGAGALAFDHEDTLVKKEAQKLTMTVDEREIHADPDGRMRFDEEMNLPKGEDYLYLVVWDTTTGRLGTLNVSLDAKKPARVGR